MALSACSRRGLSSNENCPSSAGILFFMHGKLISFFVLERPSRYTCAQAWRYAKNCLLEGFNSDRHTLAAANAERGHALLGAGLAHLVQQGHEDAGARSADRVAEARGAAAGVHLGRVEPKLAADAKALGRERLVGFEDVDLVDGPARLLQGELGGRDRAHAHDLRVHASAGVRDDAAERGAAELRSHRLRGDHHGSGAVVDARRVAGGHGAVLLERGAELAELLRGGAGCRKESGFVSSSQHAAPARRPQRSR
mmetsp:Transcript_1505/g.4691  ORF Transcript_1505/g.4691 Transcript_1505/m.4691 type:complete len:254 (-) Transcript_1505:821-1582(-)